MKKPSRVMISNLFTRGSSSVWAHVANVVVNGTTFAACYVTDEFGTYANRLVLVEYSVFDQQIPTFYHLMDKPVVYLPDEGIQVSLDYGMAKGAYVYGTDITVLEDAQCIFINPMVDIFVNSDSRFENVYMFNEHVQATRASSGIMGKIKQQIIRWLS